MYQGHGFYYTLSANVIQILIADLRIKGYRRLNHGLKRITRITRIKSQILYGLRGFRRLFSHLRNPLICGQSAI
jgi:hypothetical protein